MRERPDNTPDMVWIEFEQLAEEEGYGDMTEDWAPWFLAFSKGVYIGVVMSTQQIEEKLV